MRSRKPLIFVFALVMSLITYSSAYGYLMPQPDIEYPMTYHGYLTPFPDVEIFQETIIKAYDKPTFSETVTVIVGG